MQGIVQANRANDLDRADGSGRHAVDLSFRHRRGRSRGNIPGADADRQSANRGCLPDGSGTGTDRTAGTDPWRGQGACLLRISGSETQVYATEQKTETDGSRTSRESKHVLIGSGNAQSALVEQIQAPRIIGAVVVCEGGDSIQVKEQIYQAVSVACSISTAQIYVAAMKS